MSPQDISMQRGDWQNYLDPGEKIVWQGAPPRGFMLRPQDTMGIPVGLAFLGFAIFWEASVLGLTFDMHDHTPPIFFPLWGAMFVIVGLYLAVGRFFWDAAARRRTSYALTNRRALIMRGMWSRELRSFPLTAASEISSRENANGRGTITFGAQVASPYGFRGWPNSYAQSFEFEGIDKVREILRAIREVQQAKA